MRVRVRLARPVVGADAGVALFEDAGGAWAEMVAVGAADLRTRYTLLIRMRRDVAPGWRVVLADRRLRVTAIADHDPRATRLRIECEHDFA